ncbi:hypothetical protein IC617_03225 [Neiella sp. HB171785]|uniref:Uncharacterized protein n=1 Tax=Neiella litorisoli TaxID=2771431 RepID=A0A8J6QFI9_9GAMM|nr:hypothetical protein [Neiella litorisoli]MBD1388430.1 hypothetical protein [Neiella litorisoli]
MNIPTTTVRSWLQRVNDIQHPVEQINAIERVIECFGSVELAKRYVETRTNQ